MAETGAAGIAADNPSKMPPVPFPLLTTVLVSLGREVVLEEAKMPSSKLPPTADAGTVVAGRAVLPPPKSRSPRRSRRLLEFLEAFGCGSIPADGLWIKSSSPPPSPPLLVGAAGKSPSSSFNSGSSPGAPFTDGSKAVGRPFCLVVVAVSESMLVSRSSGGMGSSNAALMPSNLRKSCEYSTPLCWRSIWTWLPNASMIS